MNLFQKVYGRGIQVGWTERSWIQLCQRNQVSRRLRENISNSVMEPWTAWWLGNPAERTKHTEAPTPCPGTAWECLGNASRLHLLVHNFYHNLLPSYGKWVGYLPSLLCWVYDYWGYILQSIECSHWDLGKTIWISRLQISVCKCIIFSITSVCDLGPWWSSTVIWRPRTAIQFLYFFEMPSFTLWDLRKVLPTLPWCRLMAATKRFPDSQYLSCGTWSKHSFCTIEFCTIMRSTQTFPLRPGEDCTCIQLTWTHAYQCTILVITSINPVGIGWTFLSHLPAQDSGLSVL